MDGSMSMNPFTFLVGMAIKNTVSRTQPHSSYLEYDQYQNVEFMYVIMSLKHIQTI